MPDPDVYDYEGKKLPSCTNSEALQGPTTAFFQHLLKEGTWSNVDQALLQEYAHLSIQYHHNSLQGTSRYTAFKEELCLRRAKDAERKRMSRMNQSQQEKQRIRAIEAERRRERRSRETEEQRQKRLDRDKQRHREIRLRETQEQKQRRRARDRLRHQLKRRNKGQELHQQKKCLLLQKFQDQIHSSDMSWQPYSPNVISRMSVSKDTTLTAKIR